MSRPPVEVADIFRAHGEDYRMANASRLSGVQLRAMHAIEQCRTAALGGHVEECDDCGHQRSAYNSCRNRNCPKCQSTAARRWLERRQSEVLPVPYFHVVFTLPEEIAKVALGNQRVVYTILFRCVSQTLLQIARDKKHLGGEIGFLAILHTWGQNLEYHPHIHCVVVGGALAEANNWVSCRKRFLFSVAVLSKLFRGKFLSALNREFHKRTLCFTRKLSALNDKKAFDAFLSVAAKKSWIVYCKPPFGGPQQVLQYLGRYTHRIAISNHRLISFKDSKITFVWKDYRDQGRKKILTLCWHEFIRRFMMHIVPSGFVRIRHYGFLANRKRTVSISIIRDNLSSRCMQRLETNASALSISATPADDSFDRCPVCKKGKMLRVAILYPVKLDSS